MRAETALQYVPFGSYSDRTTCAWVMANSTLAAVLKLTDSNGNPLWQATVANGTPDTLLGFPVYTSGAMQAYSAGNFVAAFGNCRERPMF
jgi:HK97 family phage major capsid protein